MTKPCQCVPLADGHYWARHRIYKHIRGVVLLRRNKRGGRRAYVPGFTSSFDPSDFHQWSRMLRDPKASK